MSAFLQGRRNSPAEIKVSELCLKVEETVVQNNYNDIDGAAAGSNIEIPAPSHTAIRGGSKSDP